MKYIDIVMSNPPGPHSDFIEVEDNTGRSVTLGTWLQDKEDSTWVLRVTEDDLKRVMEQMS
jgi:hypothetical protein